MSDNNTYISIAELQKLIGGASNSHSIAMLNSVMAETIGMSMHNAVSTQHNAQTLNSAATTSTCAQILSVMGNKEGAPSPIKDLVPTNAKDKVDDANKGDDSTEDDNNSEDQTN